MRRSLILALAALSIWAAPALAALPQTINYQGYLTSNTAVPVNTTVSMEFRLWNAASGGTALWTETQGSVSVANGIYNVVLGSVTPITIPFDAPYFLGVTAGGDAEMTPRQPLAASPYAFRATVADTATAATTATTVSSATTVTGPVAGSQITGAITGATISGSTLAQLPGQLAASVQPPQANTITTVNTASGTNTSITIGTDGLPVIAFDSGGLRVAKCGNAACSSGNTVTLVGAAGTVQGPSIAIGADGLPVISYHGGSGSLRVAKCGNAACSSGNAVAFMSGGNGNTSIAIGADGLPVILYHYSSFQQLRVIKCGNAACSSGNTDTLLESVNSGGHGSITIGMDGLPVISYQSNGFSTLRVAKCGNSACSSGNTFTNMGTGAGTHTSITIGADGLPVISYIAFGGTDVGVAKCSNAACSSSTINFAAQTGGGTGAQTSIAIGTDGAPVISYVDFTNSDLKVVKCRDASCSGTPSSQMATAVDTAGSVGTFSSITIGADGLPVISYYDSTNVKVAKCANVFCSPYFRRR